MSNVRPWFRLSSIARPTSQGSSDSPSPLPQPRQTPSRPVLVRPPTKQPSPPSQQQPPSPPRQPPSPLRQQTPPPPQERSPYHSPPSRHTSPRTPAKTKSPFSTPPQSPTEVQETLPPRKPTSPPSPAHLTRSIKYESESFSKAPPPRVLSPDALPPSQLHSERETIQKNILTAEKTNQVHEPNHHNQNHNHQGNNIKKTHHQLSFLGSKNIMGTRVITIAGENKGAVMEILQSPLSNKSYKTGGEGTHSSRIFNSAGEKERRLQSSSSSISDEEEGKKKTTKNHNNNGNNMNLLMKAFMNSNVQLINNSIVYSSTATYDDPGIHLKIYKKPGSSNGFHVKGNGNNGGGYTN